MRLIKHAHADTECRPATSLSDLRHERRSIGDLFKTGKAGIGRSHAQSGCGVRRKTWAAFTPVALSRQFADRCEVMLLQQNPFIARSVRRITADLSRLIQPERPGRSHPRASKQPRSQWTRKPTA